MENNKAAAGLICSEIAKENASVELRQKQGRVNSDIRTFSHYGTDVFTKSQAAVPDEDSQTTFTCRDKKKNGAHKLKECLLKNAGGH